MARRRHEVTDEEWDLIRDRLPGQASDPGPTADNRLFVNAVLFVARTGVPWRDLPGRFGNWNSVWRRVDRWCASGVWPALADVLGEPDLAELHLDSTSVKAQHRAAGSRRLPDEKKAKADARRCLGRSRGAGGRDEAPRGRERRGPRRAGRPLAGSGGRRAAGDAPRAPALLAGRRPRHVVADAADDGDAIRAMLRRSRARACIKPNPTRRRKRRYDKARYRHRNVVERFFGSVKRGFRRVATRRYETKAANDLGFAWLAAVLVSIN